jgi:hypothetical protein
MGSSTASSMPANISISSLVICSLAAAQNCGINCAQIATVPMNSVIDAKVAASLMKILNIAGLPRTQAPAFQISVPAIVPVRNCGLQKSAPVQLTLG